MWDKIKNWLFPKKQKRIFSYEKFKQHFENTTPINYIEELIEDALKYLPEEFQEETKNVWIDIEDLPTEDMLKQLRQIPYAVYCGIPVNKKAVMFMPQFVIDKIILYKKIIEKECENKTEEESRDWIKRLIIHEMSHHFGFDDEFLSKCSLLKEKLPI
jgi:predicted Zn-dependent protease with MMP-like domain